MSLNENINKENCEGCPYYYAEINECMDNEVEDKDLERRCK